jgi:putative spermidine/putrescine transport system ATP-binding protein
MSGGQQQRVALARALVIRPQILLLDEPLSNLDAKLREEMQIELRQIQRNLGTTTILVTHDQHEAMALSDRIVVMNKGVIEQIGSPQETYQTPATPFVAQFLGKTNGFTGHAESNGAGIQIRIADYTYAAHAGIAGPVTVSIRPERIGFGTTGLRGAVRTRIFQGNHWLFQIETAIGIATVIRQNDGTAMPEEGQSVHLVWRNEDSFVRAADKAA